MPASREQVTGEPLVELYSPKEVGFPDVLVTGMGHPDGTRPQLVPLAPGSQEWEIAGVAYHYSLPSLRCSPPLVKRQFNRKLG